MDRRTRARQVVESWRERRYLPSPSPVHVHRLDLEKLEEMIAEALGEVEQFAQAHRKV
jgi:hypothetical protein